MIGNPRYNIAPSQPVPEARLTKDPHKAPETRSGAFFIRQTFPIVQIAQLEAGGVLFGAAGLTFMPKKRGNPNWGRPMMPASVLCTEFEMQAKHLHLTPAEYVASARLRKWCEENKNQHYVPEWLLKAWNISVNSDLTGAA